MKRLFVVGRREWWIAFDILQHNYNVSVCVCIIKKKPNPWKKKNKRVSRTPAALRLSSFEIRKTTFKKEKEMKRMTTPTRYNNTQRWVTDDNNNSSGITKTQKDVDRASRQSYRNVIHRLHMSGSDDTGRRKRRGDSFFWGVFWYKVRFSVPSALLCELSIIVGRRLSWAIGQVENWNLSQEFQPPNMGVYDEKIYIKKRPWIKSNQMKNKSWSFSNCQLCGAMIGLCGAPLNTSGHSLVHIGDRTTIYSRCVSFQGNHLFDRETIPRAHCITPKGDCLFLFLMGLLLL